MVKPVGNNAQMVNHQNFAKKTHPCAKKNLVPRAVLMKSGLISVNTARQVTMLKPGKFVLWRMRIEQYIQMIDYALWEVIENGATLLKTVVVEGVEKVMPITSTEDKAQRRLEDAKLLLEAVEKRFEIKKDVNQMLLRSLSSEVVHSCGGLEE
ncbi:hypothetical protein Tco_1343064 [Tanacetum coccineum]